MRTLLLSLILSSALCGACAHTASNRKLLPVGSEVPELERNDQNGEPVTLRGGPATLVYFYPKDDTPGCTKEACAFRDVWDRYKRAGIRVIGVSFDNETSHQRFANEYKLPFSLIADPTHTWSDAFGVGRFLGSADERVSFLIDERGKIQKVYPDVDPGVHADQVLSDAKKLKIGS